MRIKDTHVVIVIERYTIHTEVYMVVKNIKNRNYVIVAAVKNAVTVVDVEKIVDVVVAKPNKHVNANT